MARGRMINESVATDKRLNSLSIEAELVYLKTIPHLDRDGLILGDAHLLWGQVCIRRPELCDMMPSIIGEWIEAGLVIRYDGDEDPVLFFVGFAKNQIGLRYDREAASVFSPPPGYTRTQSGLVPDEIQPRKIPPHDNSGTTPAQLRQASEPSPPECNRSEENTHAPTREAEQPRHRTRADVAAQKSARLMRREYTGIKPALLTKLTNHVKLIYGYSVLIDRPGDDTIEDKMRDEAYRLWKVGFNDDESMIDLKNAWESYSAHFSNKRPGKDQLYELALSMVSGASTSSKSTVDFALEDILA